MLVAFDTSAIAKRYRLEAGRDQVEHWLGLATGVAVAAHCRVEVASSLCRDLLDGLTSEADFARDLDLVEKDFSDFSVVALDSRVERLAIEAMCKGRLRAMDALHLACAQATRVDMFVTADKQQARAAQALGMPCSVVEMV